MITVIKINRKRIGITLILLGLMAILMVFQRNFDDRIKFTVLMQNEMKDLKEYYILNNEYSYKLPYNWRTRIREFPGNEIIYHNEFSSEDSTIYGMVQVWNIKNTLDDFLSKSEEISKEQNVIENYTINKIDINNEKAYEVTYNLIDGKNNEYYSYEYFVPRKGGFIRFSFFVRKPNFKENMPAIFKAIVKTLKTV